MAYLKKVTDAKSDNGVGNGWSVCPPPCLSAGLNSSCRFKIQSTGYAGGTWGTDIVIKNAGKQVIRIPDCIENGQYLLRAEMIALHGARSSAGAQFYVCNLRSLG
jgi:hypothetical protein